MKNKLIIKLCVPVLAVLLCGCGKKPGFETADGTYIVTGQETADGADGIAGTEEACGMETGETDSGLCGTELLKDGGSGSETPASCTDSDSAESVTCYIHVCGAVKYPGVYELCQGARLCEAIEMAGGVTEDAYADGVNLALEVVDGSRVRIPTVEEWENGNYAELAEFSQTVEPDAELSRMGRMQESSEPDGLVNINTADAQELTQLPGIGATRAEAIIAYREANGAFSSIEDIQKVSGIKSGLYSKIKDKIKI